MVVSFPEMGILEGRKGGGNQDRLWILTLKFLFDILINVARRQVDVQTEGSKDRPRMNKKIWKWLAYK